MIPLANRWPVALVLLSSGLARAAASDSAGIASLPSSVTSAIPHGIIARHSRQVA